VLVGIGHIRHEWSCDRCGYGFETAVKLAAPLDADADLH
jgi:hypothetical protein